MNALQDYLEGDTSTARAAQERMDRTAKCISIFDEQMAGKDMMDEKAVQNEPTDYVERAKSLVRAQVNEEMFSTGASQFEVYVVWFCKTLQNWKAIVCTTMPDGMLYEVTHNGDNRETYIDGYRKQSNTVIPD